MNVGNYSAQNTSNMEVLLEKDLIALAQQGDTQAFERLLAETTPKLRALLISQYHLQPADIDDVLQIASAKVWKKIGTFRSESTFLTWFFIIIRNEALDLIKRNNIRATREVSSHHV